MGEGWSTQPAELTSDQDRVLPTKSTSHSSLIHHSNTGHSIVPLLVAWFTVMTGSIHVGAAYVVQV